MITGLTVGTKTVETTYRDVIALGRLSLDNSFRFAWAKDVLLCVTVFLFAMTDFVVRAVPIGYCLALAQDDTSNSTASTGLILTFMAVLVLGMAEQFLAIHYAYESPGDGTDETWTRTACYFAFPSIISCSPLLFGALGARGVPNVFALRRFFHVHWATLVQSVLVMVICICAEYNVIGEMLVFFVAFVCSLVVNLTTGLFLQFKTKWN